MEIVTDASIRSAAEAGAYVQKIRQIVRYLGASTGDMEKGALRCEANISVRPEGSEALGTKVEVKNLNSFRSVRNAIDYEVGRQVEVLEAGGQVRQVTMGWDESAEVTREQRSKEEADDYRYFPEPDLLEVDLSEAWIEEVRGRLPELPDARAAAFTALGLAPGTRNSWPRTEPWPTTSSRSWPPAPSRGPRPTGSRGRSSASSTRAAATSTR